MDETFYLRTYHRNFALIGILCSVLFTAASYLYFGLTNALENEPRFVIYFPLFPLLFFGGICSWLLLTYLRASLTLRNGQVLQNGVFRRKQIDLHCVDSLRWTHPNNIVLRSGHERLKIELEQFTIEQRLQIIRHLRQCVPLTAQSEWPRFCHLFALPLTRHGETRIPKEGEC